MMNECYRVFITKEQGGQQVDMDDRYERMDAINVAKYAVEKDGAHSALVRHEKVIFTIMQD